MTIELPALPYAKDALQPHISERTLDFHYGKHHQAYVTNLNNLVKSTDLETASLEDIIHATVGKADRAGIFNNTAQVWNHTFYWHSLSPTGGGAPRGFIADLIKSNFGSYEEFSDLFRTAAVTQFGSGWAWLILDGKTLKITKTANADTPLAHGQRALLTVDVWEHAYYLDYQNRRPDYVSVFLSHLVNWDFANANLRGS